ncbi:hypothetical protein BX666DRAFT_1986482 [Dichotomocladium elegans]|nr:hypothetical protein BX666DRAFT_1986482 [Dichotomocladium elegans]
MPLGLCTRRPSFGGWGNADSVQQHRTSLTPADIQFARLHPHALSSFISFTRL